MATWSGGQAPIAPTTPAPTILDPGDPALGNSYEDGVERARRVYLKKKKKPGESLGTTTPTGETNLDDVRGLQDAHILPQGVDPNTFELVDLGEGWAGYQINNEGSRSGLYYLPPGEIERQRKLRKPPGQNTILGG